jgi:hypothetical protein
VFALLFLKLKWQTFRLTQDICILGTLGNYASFQKLISLYRNLCKFLLERNKVLFSYC